MQLRSQPGVEALPGVDTLALHLLASTGARAELRELLQQPTQALLAALQPVLEAQGCLDALGQLQAARGHSQLALSTWQVNTCRMTQAMHHESMLVAPSILPIGSDTLFAAGCGAAAGARPKRSRGGFTCSAACSADFEQP